MDESPEVTEPTEKKRKWKLKLFCLCAAFAAGVVVGAYLASDPSDYSSGRSRP